MAIGLLLGAASCSDSGETIGSTAAPVTSTTDLPGVSAFDGLTRNHVETPVAYPQSPPVGGDHSPIWQNCGVYNGPIADENAVHSMEHGAVWLAYRPDLAANEVQILADIAKGHSHVLVSPYPGLTEAVVATAWGKQLRLATADDATIRQFVARYEQGPQTPELGVTCSGALGEPVA